MQILYDVHRVFKFGLKIHHIIITWVSLILGHGVHWKYAYLTE